MQIRVISMPEINFIPTTDCTLDDLCVCVNLKFSKQTTILLYNELHTDIVNDEAIELILYGNFEPILRGNRLTALQASEKPSKRRGFCHRSYFLLIIIFTLRTMR